MVTAVFVMELTISKGQMSVMGKRISKTFAEIADIVQHDITNKLQHMKCIRQV